MNGVRVLLALSALCVVLAAAGCGAGSGQTDKMVRTGEREPQVAEDGSLTSNPAPLTLEDLSKIRPGSAQRAVLELFFFAQWGSIPNVVASYDHDVVAAVGLEDVTGAYAFHRSSLLVSRPRIVASRRTRTGAMIALEIQSKGQPPTRDSFVLREQDGRWRVVYDTMLERALAAYVTYREHPNPEGGRPNAAASRAGAAISSRYRNMFSQQLLADRQATAARRRARSQPQPQPQATPAPTG